MFKFFGKRKPVELPVPTISSAEWRARVDWALDWRTRVDWALLRQQKSELLTAAWSGRPVDVEVANGIIHLLDAIQDEAARELGEEAVYGPMADHT